ncbi:hypothetical protein SH1V18_12140 [Vallitalea longa]|uniref:Uncharacterized protein n=1 Tax=Vallitalea longa TaxID=2936439 RepID=A0A9W5YB60_9FIRM|nr:hypothetical protein [Vallitalea longa]GKX28734.1 hypothetical protein SH1V18_12140 [Vallitalea longa]
MELKKKISIILIIAPILCLLYMLFIKDIFIDYDYKPLTEPLTNNLFDNINLYIFDSNNASITKRNISTGMYTDANYKDFYVIIEIPINNYLVENKANTYIIFQSLLQGTSEWVNNNKYSIKMFYFQDNNPDNDCITFYNEKWVGLDKLISCKQLIPKEALGNSIYIEYASEIGSFFFLKNGNDIRFFNNYLSVQ